MTGCRVGRMPGQRDLAAGVEIPVEAALLQTVRSRNGIPRLAAGSEKQEKNSSAIAWRSS